MEPPFDEKILNTLRSFPRPLTQAEISTSIPGLDFRRCGLFLATLHAHGEIERLGNQWRIAHPKPLSATVEVTPDPVEIEDKTVTPETRAAVLNSVKEFHQHTGTAIVDFLKGTGVKITYSQVLWALDELVKSGDLERKNSQFRIPESKQSKEVVRYHQASPGKSLYHKWEEVIAKVSTLKSGESVTIDSPIDGTEQKFRTNLRAILYTRKQTRDWYWDVILDNQGHCRLVKLRLKKEPAQDVEVQSTVEHTLEKSFEKTEVRITRKTKITQALEEGRPDLFIPETPQVEKELVACSVQYWTTTKTDMPEPEWDAFMEEMCGNKLPNLAEEVKLYKAARETTQYTLSKWLAEHEKVIGEIPKSALEDLWLQVHGMLLNEMRKSLPQKWRENRGQ